ncbi:uncharacterized protein LOC124148457 [Haliotis rufescens]|uniref:uncharacterized protein LOC124148457 n=1 Tax=Haliotis rufescens TaxID=6454 RepID=UPI00201F197F|nr:uncharacterized protein LOC124148457 [Haliotis rufescens]
MYINIQPESMYFSIKADFQTKVSSSPPVYISRTYIGIVDSNVTVTRRTLSGTEQTLSSTTLRGAGDCNTTLSSSTPSALVSCNITLSGSSSLQNGEWVCGLIKVFSGGSFDYKSFDGHILGNKRFIPIVESKTICFRYDKVAPVHCTTDSRFSCSSDSPLRLSTRTTKSPNITVGVSGWVDPQPVDGSPDQASGVKYFRVDVYGMKKIGLDTLEVDYANHVFASDKLIENDVNITVSLPIEPAMYVTKLEVHDVAGNIRYGRRFLLYDNSSKLGVRTARVLRVTSASIESGYTWQNHHRNILLDWNERYYNDFCINNYCFCQIKPDTSNGISGEYDQLTGILPVTGTVSIHGVTNFKYQWCLNNGLKSPWESVPDFTNQSLTLNLNLTDGETYEVWIEAQDIMLNTIVESVVVHIDRSVADIADTWLVRDGTSQIYVHSNTDLSTMVLQFRGFDVHSGISAVSWALGSNYTGLDLETGTLPVMKLQDKGYCPPGDDCYCPDVGPCEYQNYTLSLNRLVRNKSITGQHNTLYYFTLVLSNGALLKSFEHLDVLVDVTPAEIGIIQEGVMSGHDLDYTSDTNVIVSWKGFLDRESGIRNYIVSLANNRCLTAEQLNKQIPEYDALFMVVKSQRTSFNVTKRGKYFSSVLAINNALEPSDAVCSDGVFVDLEDTDVEKTNAVIICKLKM